MFKKNRFIALCPSSDCLGLKVVILPACACGTHCPPNFVTSLKRKLRSLILGIIIFSENKGGKMFSAAHTVSFSVSKAQQSPVRNFANYSRKSQAAFVSVGSVITHAVENLSDSEARAHLRGKIVASVRASKIARVLQVLIFAVSCLSIGNLFAQDLLPAKPQKLNACRKAVTDWVEFVKSTAKSQKLSACRKSLANLFAPVKMPAHNAKNAGLAHSFAVAMRSGI